jgi:FAD dependent oxidoreductase TIGR03364
MAAKTEVAIVGAGIMGLAHAWMAAEQGSRVTVFERSPRALGASIRNFGMVWPIGQVAGDALEAALASRRRWLTLASEAGIRAEPCGSIHLAHRDDEQAVLEEFCERAPALGYEVALLTPEEVLAATPAANPSGLLGGLKTFAELAVDPTEALPAIAAWLAARHGVVFEWNMAVTSVESGGLVTADGRQFDCDHVVICSGADFESLFPQTFAEAGLTRCKLQMLATVSQPDAWRLGTHLASGLTLRHYRAFEICPSIGELRTRIASETPELDHFGIHVMASQNRVGEVILGDSHEYDDAMPPFDSAEIDALILRELRRCITLADWTIARRWHGVYAKHRHATHFTAEPLPGVSVRTGPGGAGMTLAFGLAEREWHQTSSAAAARGES